MHRYAERYLGYADIAGAPVVDCENLFMNQ